MNSNEYQDRANALAAEATPEVKERLVKAARWLDIYFTNIEGFGDKLDEIKKYAFYNRQNDFSLKDPAPFGDEAANARLAECADLIHAIIGLATEQAELITAVMAYVNTGKPLDKVNLLEELGDLDWYKVLALKTIEYTNEQCQERNINKLESRYKGGFSQQAANNRDLETERKILEDGQTVEVANT